MSVALGLIISAEYINDKYVRNVYAPINLCSQVEFLAAEIIGLRCIEEYPSIFKDLKASWKEMIRILNAEMGDSATTPTNRGYADMTRLNQITGAVDVEARKVAVWVILR